MTLPIQVKPIITQEKGEKHVFRKSKKYHAIIKLGRRTYDNAVAESTYQLLRLNLSTKKLSTV